MSNHRWYRDDEIIALNAYSNGGQDADVSDAVELVNLRAQRDGKGSFDKHGSMIMRLENFQYLATDGAKGLSNAAAQTVAVWEELGNDPNALDQEMARIIASLPNK